eukprot:CAMPEP_0172466784 /NCGR_PEP_ID=MMETSP1065-20121228/57143_1 /TAXON_ID=265537 /ORGANISM="Amphiprora paludosa, Strain CCMP125" /LENGTH=51 /DNA_ID=CAMNT_0013223709 /DNA_START=90 /DNA_END=242 /DNA_ORIENTATION=-
MKCLSVPDHLGKLADDIRAMELDLEKRQGGRPDKKQNRIMSFHDLKDLAKD